MSRKDNSKTVCHSLGDVLEMYMYLLVLIINSSLSYDIYDSIMIINSNTHSDESVLVEAQPQKGLKSNTNVISWWWWCANLDGRKSLNHSFCLIRIWFAICDYCAVFHTLLQGSKVLITRNWFNLPTPTVNTSRICTANFIFVMEQCIKLDKSMA